MQIFLLLLLTLAAVMNWDIKSGQKLRGQFANAYPFCITPDSKPPSSVRRFSAAIYKVNSVSSSERFLNLAANLPIVATMKCFALPKKRARKWCNTFGKTLSLRLETSLYSLQCKHFENNAQGWTVRWLFLYWRGGVCGRATPVFLCKWWTHPE